ncbi:MAG: caspase domain-containing protein [Ktedonobacteraceae bacterium]
MAGRPQTYALLIGIDEYLPNSLPGDAHYERLMGCVRDALQMEELLKSRLRIPDEHIVKLLAPLGSTTSAEQQPTYTNIVAAFQKLVEMAQPGDFIYIYYAGHGGRARSLTPEVKQIDECLVPVDIGTPGARYLRDVELAYLLREMGDRKLTVTIILDCCFSGGATRGQGGVTIRGLHTIDMTPRPTESLVAAREVLVDAWRSLSGGTTRGFPWIPDSGGYVLLAACRTTECAYEYPFGGHEGHGVFTYWLMDALKRAGPDYTYKMLLERVLAKVHAQFERQTPLILGEANRLVFSGDALQPQYAVTVIVAEMDQRRVLLQAGAVHAVSKGAKFAIYPQGVVDFSRVEKCLAVVEITQLGSTESWARIVDILNPDPIEPGAQAALRDPGGVCFQRSVLLVHREDLPPTIDQARALNSVRQAIEHQNSRFVQIAERNQDVDFQVAISAQGYYEIWDPAGESIANLRPPLHIGEERSAEQLAQRLTHLAKYRNIQQLDNTDAYSPLAGKLLLTPLGKQSEYHPADLPVPEPFDDPAGILLKDGEWLFLRVKNASSQPLNITAFDLAPDWSITQVFPPDTSYETFDRGEERTLSLQAVLPPGYEEATDVLKLFATIGSTDFQWLQLSALDRPSRSRGFGGVPSNPLEELLFALVEGAPAMRTLIPGVRPTREWVTTQLEVCIQRS